MKENILDNNLIDTEDKYIFNALLARSAVERIEEPFKVLTVSDVAKDLKIGKNTAYKIFKRDDFPSVNMGQSWHITLISYIIWKMNRRV